MSKLSYIVTGTGITAVVDGETMTITSDNPSYGQVLDAIKARESASVIADLFRTANAIKRYLTQVPGTAVEVDEDAGEVTYAGEIVHNVVVDRILDFMSQQLPVEPLVRFLDRLMANPSRRSIKELYKFLEYKALPITDDGCFLAYKGVTDEFKDCHTRTFDNSVGAENSMPRSHVDDDFRVHCSKGFHAGSLDYAKGFGPTTVVVKIDPADVVSVPEDCQCQKVRVCRYKVVDVFQGEITSPLVNSANPYGEVASPYGY
jgi:hypothetical protein